MSERVATAEITEDQAPAAEPELAQPELAEAASKLAGLVLNGAQAERRPV